MSARICSVSGRRWSSAFATRSCLLVPCHKGRTDRKHICLFVGAYAMQHSEKKLCKRTLLALRAQTQGDVSLLLNTALDVVCDDLLRRPPGICRDCRPNWRTSVAGTLREFIGRLVSRKQAVLHHIEHALERIDNGSYGTCERCGSAIPENVLLTAPYTRLCGSCEPRRAAG